jgi:hypothetical protein
MNLHSKERPQMYERPAWLSKKSVIPPLEFWPKDGQVEVRMFLPVNDGRSHMRYHTLVDIGDLDGLVMDFENDPESTVMALFRSYKELMPNVKEVPPVVKREPGVLIPTKRARLL